MSFIIPVPKRVTLEMVREQLQTAVEARMPEVCDEITDLLFQLPEDKLRKIQKSQKHIDIYIDLALKRLSGEDAHERRKKKRNPNSPLPSTLTVLGEHLHYLVEEMDADKADQITGTLLELGQREVLMMLEQPPLLKKRVNNTQKALRRSSKEPFFVNFYDDDDLNSPMTSSDSAYASREDIAELIYDKVEKIDPENCSKITGMLLELPLEVLRKLLMSQSELEERIETAVQVIECEEASDV